jgi:SprT protein
MQVSKAIMAQVELKIQDGINRATAYFGREFAFPSISYNLSGKTAGTATYQRNHIRLNAVLLMENTEEFIARTVPHELGHLITWEMYSNDWSFYNRSTGRIAHHGLRWKSICTLIGMDDVTRCHQYDVSNSGRKSTQYVWGCQCGAIMAVSKVKHNNMMGRTYTHKCGGRRRGSLSFIVDVEGATKQGAVQQVRDGLAQVETVKPVELKKPVKRHVRKAAGRSNKVSNLGQARAYARATPGVDSSTLRNWAEMTLNVSAHSARGIWSKLKKEGLVG